MGTHLPTWIDLQAVLPSLFAFVAVIATILGALYVVRGRANQRIRDRLHDVVTDRNEEGLDDLILRDIELS